MNEVVVMSGKLARSAKTGSSHALRKRPKYSTPIWYLSSVCVCVCDPNSHYLISGSVLLLLLIQLMMLLQRHLPVV